MPGPHEYARKRWRSLRDAERTLCMYASFCGFKMPNVRASRHTPDRLVPLRCDGRHRLRDEGARPCLSCAAAPVPLPTSPPVAAKHRHPATDLEHVARGQHPSGEHLGDAAPSMRSTVRPLQGRASPTSFSGIRGSQMEAVAGRANPARSTLPSDKRVRCRSSTACSHLRRMPALDDQIRWLRRFDCDFRPPMPLGAPS